MILRWALVMIVAVAVLAGLDRIPTLITGATHGARVFGTIEDAQEALGAELWLPSYYPDVLAWPPERIEADAGVVAIRIADRRSRVERLVICQVLGTASGGQEASFRELLPRAEEMGAAEAGVNESPGRLVRLMTPGGRIVHDLSWMQHGRSLVMRYDGPVADLLRMAASMGRAQR